MGEEYAYCQYQHKSEKWDLKELFSRRWKIASSQTVASVEVQHLVQETAGFVCDWFSVSLESLSLFAILGVVLLGSWCQTFVYSVFCLLPPLMYC